MAQVVTASAHFINHSTKVITSIKVLQSKVQDLPAEIQVYRHKLEELQDVVHKIDADPALCHVEIESHIDRCTALSIALSRIFDELNLKKPDEFDRKTWKGIGGPDKESELGDLFEEIDGIKSSLTAHLGMVIVNRGIDIPSRLLTLEPIVPPGTEHEYCLQALFYTYALGDREYLITTQGPRTPGTCTWVPSTTEYQAWDHAPSGILWISGPAGTGKTFIAIYLSQLLEVSKPDATLLVFFCDGNISTRNTAVGILRGLMQQLVHQHASLISCMTGSWEVQRDTLFGEKSFDELWRIFEEMLDRVRGREIYLVLDGLDECKEGSLRGFLSKLTALVSRTSPGCRLKCIITSHDTPQCLPNFLSPFPHIRVDQVNHDDINLYISEKASHIATKDSTLHQRIIETFTERSEGSFLWVKLMAEDLETKSVDEIEECLDHLPQGLDKVYEETLEEITDSEVHEILLWLSLATRPLSIPELCDAVQITPKSNLSREDVCKGYITSCSHLLQTSSNYNTIDNFGCLTNEERVTFSHQTAKDFFSPTQKGHLDIATRLLDYMADVPQDIWHDWDDSAEEEECQKQYPLLEYAIHNWYQHAGELDEKSTQLLIERNPEFFGKESLVRDNWVQATNWSHSFIPGGDCPVLHIACLLGLETLLRLTLRSVPSIFKLLRRSQVNVPIGPANETPLHLAVKEKHAHIVPLLLQHGADPCLADRNYLTPIHHAAEQSPAIFDILARHYKAKKYLLGSDKTLLHLAARAGHEDTCRFLIEKFNRDVNYIDPNPESTALEMALKGGHLKLARRLVSEWGAKIHSPKQILTAIAKARLGENDLITTLRFLSTTSNLSLTTPDDEGNTILHNSLNPPSSLKAFHLITLLPSLSSTRTARGRTILDVSDIEPIFILTLLFAVQHGLDLNNQDVNGQTVLHHFVFAVSGYVSDVFPDYIRYARVLLDLGARRDVKDNEGRTAGDVARDVLARPSRAPFRLSADGEGILEKYDMAQILQEDSPESGFDDLGTCDDESLRAIRWTVRRQQPLRIFLELLDTYNTVPINPSRMPTISPAYFSQDHDLYGPWAQALQWGETWAFNSLWASSHAF